MTALPDSAKALYEADTLRHTPGAKFEWFGERDCRTTNGPHYVVVRVWNNGCFEILEPRT